VERNPHTGPQGGRKARRFAGISQVLGSLLDQAGLSHLMYEEKLRARWTELMGPKAAAIAKLESLKGWTLKVRVESATWRNELHFQKDALRKRANELLGAELVKDIQLM
jgi:predicted nucleic acid-binding Zn ribbon protein